TYEMLLYGDNLLMLFFFFSSRRRHTRSKRDWSSDVCSSDLGDNRVHSSPHADGRGDLSFDEGDGARGGDDERLEQVGDLGGQTLEEFDDGIHCVLLNDDRQIRSRSEERRVGREWRARWCTAH